MAGRDETGRRCLDRLDAQTALQHLQTAAHATELAGLRASDIARRELKHGWDTLDRKMEDSTLVGSGQQGSPFAFTEWDGIKQVAANAARTANRDVDAVRSRLQRLPQAVSNPYPTSFTDNLKRGVQLHGSFASRYLGYAAKDAGEALRQAGMASRYAFEVGRRELLDNGEPDKPRVFKDRSPADPLKQLADDQEHQRRAAMGLAAATGVAATAAGIAVDVGLGYALERAEKRRRAREAREELAARTGCL